MVAFLATSYYGSTNPVLCVFVWLWAIRGDFIEQRRIIAFQRAGFSSFEVYNIGPGGMQWSELRSGRGFVKTHPKDDNDVIDVDADIIE